jgi:hypothetical protein
MGEMNNPIDVIFPVLAHQTKENPAPLRVHNKAMSMLRLVKKIL